MNFEKIMVVEDDSLVGLDIQNNLQDMGYNIPQVYSSASEALNALPDEEPDLVLMDIQLRDGMDGIDAAFIVSNQFNIPVLFLTAYADKEILERARKVGAFGYMVKPFTNRELHAVVEVALSKHRLDKEKKQLEEHIRLAQKMESLRLMAGGLAHRLNNSLQAVIGNLSLATDGSQNSRNINTNLLEAKKAASHAADLGKQLLACSGHGFFNPENLNLNTSIHQALGTLKDVFPKGLDLNLELAEDLPDIHVDSSQLDEVFVALITNAVEAMDTSRGMITIKTNVSFCDQNYWQKVGWENLMEEGQYVSFSVTDTGCGMEDSVSSKMFDPFFTTKFMGRGLGLAAVLGSVQSHKGTIVAKSTPGEGTTIKVLFPALENSGI
jgi:signal transduction histidine kinase